MTRNHKPIHLRRRPRAVAGWDFGAVDQASVRFAAKVRAQELAEEQARENEARQAGFTEGYAQGHAQATLEGQRQIAQYIENQGQDAARQFGQLFDAAGAQIAESQQVMAKGGAGAGVRTGAPGVAPRAVHQPQCLAAGDSRSAGRAGYGLQGRGRAAEPSGSGCAGRRVAARSSRVCP